MIKSQTSVWLFLCATVSRSPGKASTPPPGLGAQSRRRYTRPGSPPHVTLTSDGLEAARHQTPSCKLERVAHTD